MQAARERRAERDGGSGCCGRSGSAGHWNVDVDDPQFPDVGRGGSLMAMLILIACCFVAWFGRMKLDAPPVVPPVLVDAGLRMVNGNLQMMHLQQLQQHQH
ncbi:hypothetical protein AMTR_s00002p00247930 [Amborella trichopoda]|uniref:Uncharacterized protein n=1 Tax=Amborella trichopoda TaxID=13333 RepID=W1P141_AMBTC|nr:hypothetical protein AMTR_s00002p00247930 [Amborella trichopoda]